MNPILDENFAVGECYFRMAQLPDKSYPDPLIPSLPKEQRRIRGTSATVGYIAVRESRRWRVIKASTSIEFPHKINCDIPDEPFHQPEAVAYPVDSRITGIDIEGATSIEANATNNGWLFFHDHESSHQDHLLAVDAAIAALFGPLVDAALYKVATATNAVVRGKVDAKYKALIAFRDEVIAAAQVAEKAHHVGHFVQTHPPEQGHVHKAVRLALSAAKVSFAASTEKIAQYRLISTEAAALIARMGAPHQPETRWDKAARIAAEKKAAAEAASNADTSQGQ